METTKVVTIHVAQKTPELLAFFGPAFTNKTAPLAPIKNGAFDTSGNVFVVCFDGEVVGVFAVEKHTRRCGTIEANITAASGNLSGGDLVASVLPQVEQIAKQAGCGSIMFETKRRGLMKKAQALGYAESSRIYRKKLI